MKLDKSSDVHPVKRIYPYLFILLVFVSCLTFSVKNSHAADLKGPIMVGGTGSELGSLKELADAYKKSCPDVKIVILPSMGSAGGIKAVNEGAVDIGLSSRPLKDNEQQYGASAVEHARTPFVFIVAEKNDRLNFTLQDIAGIFSGVRRNWPDGTPIRLVLRPESEIDTIVMKGMSPEMERAVSKALSQEGMMVAVTDQENADAVGKIRGAIGTSTLAQIISEKRDLNTISLNGVVPDIENLANGSYHYYKSLYIVTGPKSRPPARDFIKFINSREGSAILAKTGHLTF